MIRESHCRLAQAGIVASRVPSLSHEQISKLKEAQASSELAKLLSCQGQKSFKGSSSRSRSHDPPTFVRAAEQPSPGLPPPAVLSLSKTACPPSPADDPGAQSSVGICRDQDREPEAALLASPQSMQVVSKAPPPQPNPASTPVSRAAAAAAAP